MVLLYVAYINIYIYAIHTLNDAENTSNAYADRICEKRWASAMERKSSGKSERDLNSARRRDWVDIIYLKEMNREKNTHER